MQLALYRAERPEVFDEIIGQKHIVRILQNQIRTGTVSQAYLFSGTHGTGKTTTARILAKAVNCTAGAPGEEGGASLPCGHCENCEAIREGRFVDCIELDAASNNGVDDLRAIIDMVKYPPSIGRYKVYIIDEVHMLTQAAENAFLKTLEEPPEHAIFILATTDPQKVRSTIRSRCMQLNFKRVSEEELVAGMEKICRKHNVETTRDALTTIASRSDGSVRDALSILEQCMAAGDEKLDRNLVLEYTGAAGDDFFLALTDAVISGNIGKAMIYIDEIAKRGKDAKQILKDWLSHYRSLMIVKYVEKAERIIGSSAENLTRFREQASRIDIAEIERAIRLMSEYINIGRYSERPRILLEMTAIRLSSGVGIEAVIQSAPQSVPAKVTGSVARKVPKPARTATPREESPAVRKAPETAGNPVEMWERIFAEVSRTDELFETMCRDSARGLSYNDGELTVMVRPSKLRTLEDKEGTINIVAKEIYGSETFVTLRGGEITQTLADRMGADQEPMDRDEMVAQAESDIVASLGIKPEII